MRLATLYQVGMRNRALEIIFDLMHMPAAASRRDGEYEEKKIMIRHQRIKHTKVRRGAYFEKFFGVPHPGRHALQVYVQRGDGVAFEELGFVNFEYGDRNAEEHVHAFKEKDVPDTEQSLRNDSI